RYAATIPSGNGTGVAFIAELVISFLMMTMILNVSNSAHIARFTGVLAGALVANYITVEAPLSGMSMSPARTFASAASGHIWNALWVYFTAPPLGMLLAAQVYLCLRGKHVVFCAKLHHDNDKRCIFHSVAHDGSGNASFYQLSDGKRILRFTNFKTSNGPDVHVYLVAANDATDSKTVKIAGYREIGSLKGNIGDQNYEMPADVDLS